MSENMSDVDQSSRVGSPNGGIQPIDFNTAEPEQLAQIPGLGPKIAERIVESRPFESLSDLQRVVGIGPSVLERIAPFVALDSDNNRMESVVEMVEEIEPVEMVEETDLVEVLEGELLDEDDAELAEEAGDELSELDATTEPGDMEVELPKPDDEFEETFVGTMDLEPDMAEVEGVGAPEAEPSEAALSKFMTRGQTFWLVVGSSFVAFALALLLSLAILAGINNGGLRFALPGEMAGVNRRVEGLLEQAQVLQADLNGLRTRMDNLETLGGRMDGVEAMTSQLATDLEATGEQISALNEEAAALGQQVQVVGEQVQAVGEQVSTLESENEQFRTFFGGLQDLLNQVFAPVEAP